MNTIVTTHDRDRLDQWVYRHYGHLRGSVEAVLDANPGLAQQPMELPAGLAMMAPDLPSPYRVADVHLWGPPL